MKTLSLKTAKTENMFQQLHQNFGGSLTIGPEEFLLELDKGLGRGQVKGFIFKGGIS
jgi:hypothetical protein